MPGLRQKLPLRPRVSVLERISLIIGFALTIASLVGAQFYLQPSVDRTQATLQDLDETWARLKIIRSAQALLGLLQSFDGLIYLVPADFSHNLDGANIVAEVSTRAVHGRHEAIRNYLAQVASAGEIDFAETLKRYETLVSAENARWSLETYRATNSLPADLSMKVGTDRWRLESSVLTQENAFFVWLMETSRRAWLITLLGVAGSGIIFVLALVASTDTLPADPSADPMRRATELINAALSEAHRRLAEERQA